MKRKATTEDFIEEATKIHGNYYDYSKVDYINSNINVIIICPEHGEFTQLPYVHINRKSGCKKCSSKTNSSQQKKTTEEFIEEATKIHGNYYDYSKVEYKGAFEKVCIICPKHGKFWQVASKHIKIIKNRKRNGHGCETCGTERTKSTKEEFVRKAKIINGDYYDYSKVDYINSKTPVIIICSKHGEFLQKPNIHLSGHGCGFCNNAKSLNEIKIREILENKKIEFKQQVSFKDCKRKKRGKLRFDFGIYKKEKLLFLIEYDGVQHFKSNEYFGGNIVLIDSQERDMIKEEYCKKNGIKLFRINYLQNTEKELLEILTKNNLDVIIN